VVGYLNIETEVNGLVNLSSAMNFCAIRAAASGIIQRIHKWLVLMDAIMLLNFSDCALFWPVQ